MPDTAYVHPLDPEEHFEVISAVKSMISVLPEGDDERGKARTRLISALDKLEAHWCPWCPTEVRDLAANAHNAVVNYGSPRERKKMGDLTRAINNYEPLRVEHFRAINDYEAHQPVCDRLPGCGIRPGGHFHDPECIIERARR